MKKTLLCLMGVGALFVSLPARAEAALFVSLQSGATTVTCDTSTAAGVAACSAAGFNVGGVGDNSITFQGTVGGFSFLDPAEFRLVANVPGTPSLARTVASEFTLTNDGSSGNTLLLNFAAFDFTLPAGPELILSSSLNANFTTVAGINSKSLVGFADAQAGTSIAGAEATATAATININAGGLTVSGSSQSPDVPFLRDPINPFSLGGVSTIVLTPGSEATFSQIVAATNAIPEPTSMILLGTGLLGVARSVRNRRRKLA